MTQLITDVNVFDRLKAWWNGYEWEPHPHAREEKSPSEDAEDEDNFPQPGERREWTPERVHVAQLIFGAGCHGPDMSARTSEMIAPLGLTPEATALEIGAGLGMCSRTLVSKTGAWIDAIEPNECLAAAGRRLTAQSPNSDKVTLTSNELTDPSITRRRRDAVLFCESLHRFDAPEAVLKQIRGLMKPSAYLILTDYFLADEAEPGDIAEWVAMHAGAVRPFKLEALRSKLSNLGFEIHSVHDETENYAAAAMKAMQTFARRINDRPVELRWRQWVMVEIEFWARTVTLLESGKLKNHRISASIHP